MGGSDVASLTMTEKMQAFENAFELMAAPANKLDLHKVCCDTVVYICYDLYQHKGPFRV